MIPPILMRIEALGHAIFTNGDWNLNLFGVRAASRDSNAFDDWIGCAYKEDGLWRVEWWEATTDPGDNYLEKPINSAGCAILKPGQYRGAYKIAKHRGEYDALCQLGAEVTVYRDDNKDDVLNMDADDTQTGWFGINIHKRSGTDDTVDAASAGCQVFRYENAFSRMMYLARRQESERGWDTYTYTLINEEDLS
jgi:hypothetical protein